MIVVWVFVIAIGPYAFDIYQIFLESLLGRSLLFAWTFSLFFHLTNGIRHLLWDLGWGFEIQKVYLTGWIVVGMSCLLTGVIWLLPLIY